MSLSEKFRRSIRSSAPTRICDLGGWTDTWFAEYGSVLNIAVSPSVEVQLDVFRNDGNSARFTIHARDFDDCYTITQPNGSYDRHPLIEAALDCMRPPEELALELTIASDAPAGCSTGTSAAVTVAIIGALDALTPGRLGPYEVAATAQRIETEFLHRQCGIQDQLAAAFGGISFIEMHRYPQAKVHRIMLPTATEQELSARLALIYVGQAHTSSEVHEMVIRNLENAGSEAPQLQRLRAIAASGRDALHGDDFVAFGRMMIENTEAQADLHPQLVGAAHQQIIAIARECGALGWKVNGAGGEGGSVTLLCGPDQAEREAMLRTIERANPEYRVIPVRPSAEGLRVWELSDGPP